MKAVIREHPFDYTDEDMYDAVIEAMDATALLVMMYDKAFYSYILKNHFNFTNEQLQEVENYYDTYMQNEEINKAISKSEVARKFKEDTLEKIRVYLDNEFSLRLTSLFEYNAEDPNNHYQISKSTSITSSADKVGKPLLSATTQGRLVVYYKKTM